ncbi:MAG TPA: hypothetical protein VIV12_28705 [Streptosporangiaceae bacterium]
MDETARFNPYHAKAGSPTGGQFTSSSGTGGSGGGKTTTGGTAKTSGTTLSSAQRVEKARLLTQAHEDEKKARELEKQLHGLEQQEHAASMAAKKSAAAAAAAKKAGHVVHHHHHVTHHKHHTHHAATLKQRIGALKTEIHGLREKAASLEKQANAIRAAGAVTNPSGTERLHQYWVHGEGAAKIRWGEPNDFQRCVDHLGKYIKDPKGYCNLAHHAALGMWPAQHAEMEKARRSAVTTPGPDYDSDGLDSSWDGDLSDLPDLSGLQQHHFDQAATDMGEPASTASRAAPKLGTGKRFAKLKASLAAKGAHDPGALAAYIGRRKFGKAKFTKLASAARKKSGGSASRSGEYMRMYPLENIEILRSERDGDGHEGAVVEAYAAVFGQPAEIKDHEGHYVEEIDRGAFDTAIAFAQRNTGGLGANVKVLYNHGLTVQGTPAPEFQLPIGVPLDIKAEERGLLTRTRYDVEDPFVQRLLGKIRQGSITAQSFVGRIIRSDPPLRRGMTYQPDGAGNLRTVRRMKLGLREYGPVLWAAYTGAEILGVRMSIPGGAPDPDEEFDAQALPPDGGPAFAGDDPLPEVEHSARYHQHALYALRSKEMREKAGLAW